MMKSFDAWLIASIFAVWGVLATLYATIPMIYMPPSIRVWGLGALLFLVLAVVVKVAEVIGGRRRAACD